MSLALHLEEDTRALAALPKEEIILRYTDALRQLRANSDRKPQKSDSKIDANSSTSVSKSSEINPSSGARRQRSDSQRRDNILVMRLATKEQQLQDVTTRLDELRTSTGSGLRHALLDPVVNSLFQKLHKELRDAKAKLAESQKELSAWKFTPDSMTGKKLMSRCQTLIDENRELGELVDSGAVAQVKADLELERAAAKQLRRTQKEADALLVSLDQDMEGLQTTVMYLQGQLAAARAENAQLRRMVHLGADEKLPVDDATDGGPLGSHAEKDPFVQAVLHEADKLKDTGVDERVQPHQPQPMPKPSPKHEKSATPVAASYVNGTVKAEPQHTPSPHSNSGRHHSQVKKESGHSPRQKQRPVDGVHAPSASGRSSGKAHSSGVFVPPPQHQQQQSTSLGYSSSRRADDGTSFNSPSRHNHGGKRSRSRSKLRSEQWRDSAGGGARPRHTVGDSKRTRIDDVPGRQVRREVPRAKRRPETLRRGNAAGHRKVAAGYRTRPVNGIRP